MPTVYYDGLFRCDWCGGRFEDIPKHWEACPKADEAKREGLTRHWREDGTVDVTEDGRHAGSAAPEGP